MMLVLHIIEILGGAGLGGGIFWMGTDGVR